MYYKRNFFYLSLIVISLIPVFIFISHVMASDYSEDFQKANGLYKENDFTGAIKIYEKLLRDGAISPSLYYNLGNAYFKSGSNGRAILYYEKAMKLNPRDKEIKSNLNYVRSLTADKQFDSNNGFTDFFLSGLDGFFTINELTLIAIVFYILITVTVIIYIFTDRYNIKFYIKIVASFLIFFSLFFSYFLSVRIYHNEFNLRAIVMSLEEKARSGPGENYTEVFTIHEGSWIYLRQKQGDWSQITLPGGYTGWIKSNSLETI